MYRFCVIALVFTSGLLFAVTGLLYWPVEIIRSNVKEYKVLTPVVTVGGNLIYQIDSCKLMDVQGTVYRSFVDDVRYPTISSTGIVRPGCRKTNVEITVPNFVEPGKYHLELDVVYQVNFLRTQTYHFRTQDFKVI